MPAVGRIVIYARDVEKSASFFVEHFGFEVKREEGDHIVELLHPEGGATLLLHPAAKSQTRGSAVKLVFDVPDVEDFIRKSSLRFGALHKAKGYVFANAKDADGNPLQVSSRAFKPPAG